jgi:hypothetical protein
MPSDDDHGNPREAGVMARRSNHYDAAFERFLRQSRTPYVAVDETRRALLEEASLKSLDFIVYSPRGRNLLVDVKGRQFPSGGGATWENWATEDDVSSMLRWQEVFGDGFRALLVFAYHVLEPRFLTTFDAASVVEHRDGTYAFYGVWVEDFEARMRTRSPRWGTVNLPRPSFRQLRAPLAEVLSIPTADNAADHPVASPADQ